MGPDQTGVNPTPMLNQTTKNTLGVPAKNNKAMLWRLGILAVVGITAAVAFAALYFSDQGSTLPVAVENNITEVTNESSDSTSSGVFNNEIAQNLINPYMKEFFFNHNVLDVDFDDTAKAEIAYLNLNPSSVVAVPTSDGSSAFRIGYYDLNSTYQQLFGSSTELAKQNFTSDHTSSLEYDAATDSFTVRNNGYGGTGATMFSIVKSASIDGENLSVEVYHDQIPHCDVNPNDGYCYNSNDLPLTLQSSVIQNFGDQIPVYTMTFTEENGHFVLSSIQK